MNSAILTGKVVAEVKVINTNNGTPLCRFTLEVQDRKFNCLIAGMKAYKFMYDVEKNSAITIEGSINNRMQLVVQKYNVDSRPSYFGQIFDYKGRKMPHRKVML
ncbi:MAG: single-stranded DNA-binding protein [Carnobacterium sp.]|uniref:single-stranded DNA-binding protein n=1 Tax=Carnobacterium sp. TaxID=48221 RepID=UPI003C75913D